MKNRKITWKEWISYFTFAIILIIIFKTIDNISEITQAIQSFLGIVAPFLVAILLAYLLYVPCKKVEKFYEQRKWKWISKRARGMSVLTVYILAGIILALGIKFLLPVIVQSFIDLADNLQGYYNTIIAGFNELPEDSIFKSQFVKDILSNIQNIDLKQYINMDQIAQYAKSVISIAGKVFDVFVSVVASIYILLERRQIITFIRSFLKAIWGEKVCMTIGGYFRKTNEIFFRFVASQFLDAIVVGMLTSVAMSILQVKYAVLLGFFIGLANMIPYFGAIFAVGLSVIITILTGGWGKALAMAIVVIVLQQIDANIINPKIVGNSLQISPLLVIFAVTVGGAYFGVIGMFLAVPVATVAKILITDYINYKETKRDGQFSNI